MAIDAVTVLATEASDVLFARSSFLVLYCETVSGMAGSVCKYADREKRRKLFRRPLPWALCSLSLRFHCETLSGDGGFECKVAQGKTEPVIAKVSRFLTDDSRCRPVARPR